MTATVRIRPEVLTEHRYRMEMYGLDDEDIENTVRMKGWAWNRSRMAWAYAGEPDFMHRQLREVVIGLPTSPSTRPASRNRSAPSSKRRGATKSARRAGRSSARP